MLLSDPRPWWKVLSSDRAGSVICLFGLMTLMGKSHRPWGELLPARGVSTICSYR